MEYKFSEFKLILILLQGDQKVSVHLIILLQKTRKNPYNDLKMTITESNRNVNRAIPKTVFENTVRRVNKCQGLAGDTLNIAFNFLYCNH
jgi:hypothetical protein